MKITTGRTFKTNSDNRFLKASVTPNVNIYKEGKISID